MPPETEMLDGVDAAPDSGAEDAAPVEETASEGTEQAGNQPETDPEGQESAETEAQDAGDVKNDPKAGQQAPPTDNLTVTRAELHGLVQAMAKQTALQEQRLQAEARREQEKSKPVYKSEWEKDPQLQAFKPEVRSLTHKQVRASMLDEFQNEGIDLGTLKALPEVLRELQAFAYGSRFEAEARQAGEEFGLRGEDLKKADDYAREQWRKNRSGDYQAMFAEYVWKRDKDKRDADVRAEKNGREAKRQDQRSGDTKPTTRSGGEKTFAASKHAEEAMRNGDLTVMLAEMRRARGITE